MPVGWMGTPDSESLVDAGCMDLPIRAGAVHASWMVPGVSPEPGIFFPSYCQYSWASWPDWNNACEYKQWPGIKHTH